MTLKEMVEAVEAGKTVIDRSGNKVYKDIESKQGPYIYEDVLGRCERATSVWANFEEFKILEEPKWRPFEVGEMPEEYFDYIYRHKATNNYINKPIVCNMYNSYLKFGNDWISPNILFREWEVKINGKWQPVGVKEV